MSGESGITLYHNVTHAPVHIERTLRDEVLVKAYRKPEQVGHIVIPEIAQQDRTQTLWEVVLSNERADAEAGMALTPGTILQSLRRWPRDTHLVDHEGHPVLLLSVSICGVRGIITYAP